MPTPDREHPEFDADSNVDTILDAKLTWHAADQPDDSRTYPQLRSDIARDLLMEGAVQPLEASGDSPAGRGTAHVQVQVSVSIPALTLLAKSQLPATLNGVGPNPLDLATELAGEATTFRRVLTDPVNGSILDAESATRRLSADLEWLVRHVNKTGRGPGCNRPAAACDIDHTIPWAHAGPTRFGNLGPLHRGHHTVKHDGGWTLKQVEPGVFTWISPTGNEITIHPDDYCPF